MRVLLVDDDPEFLDFVKTSMDRKKIEHVAVASAAEAVVVLGETPPGQFDLILLDIEMPGASGFDFLFDVREAGNEIPVVFVTGRDAVEDRVRGLRLGADDYVIKPIAFEELIARLENVLRRRRSLEPIEYGDLRIDLALRRVKRGGQSVSLSPREYDLLLALVRASGKPVSRAELLQQVWDLSFDPGTNVVEVHIGRVRKKLDRHGRPLIETVRGEGYRVVRHLPE